MTAEGAESVVSDATTRTETVTVPSFTRTLEIGPGERVCPECGGAVVVIEKTANAENGHYIVTCKHCLSGKQKRCPFCGEWGPPFHRCSGWWDNSRKEDAALEIAKFDSARHLTVAEAVSAGVEYCYWPGADGDRVFLLDDIEEKADEVEDDTTVRPTFAWATTTQTLVLDATAILESAAEDLHEEALSGIGRDAESELQNFLDAWVARYGSSTSTYYADYTRAVLVPAKPLEEADS